MNVKMLLSIVVILVPIPSAQLLEITVKRTDSLNSQQYPFKPSQIVNITTVHHTMANIIMYYT